MTPRQLHRAAERKQRKQERKAANGFVFSTDASPALSGAQLAANRANSQLSTGSKTAEGKAESCLNAVKSALTGRTVLLPTDDAAAYEHHVREYFKEFQPVGLRETSLVQALADTAWRLGRIPVLEMAIYVQGRIRFAEQFENEDTALRPGLIELHTYLAYEKQLRNPALTGNAPPPSTRKGHCRTAPAPTRAHFEPGDQRRLNSLHSSYGLTPSCNHSASVPVPSS